jgi:hypothetical protein
VVKCGRLKTQMFVWILGHRLLRVRGFKSRPLHLSLFPCCEVRFHVTPCLSSEGRWFDPTFSHMGGIAQSGERQTEVHFCWPNWRNGSAPAYGAGGCGFEPHVGLG